ncbi:MAG: conjugal transfer protein TraF [Magnetococcales bacterium]|nr:conjugal transfer protein TraF [Magnetococcales bacterium]
MKTLDHNGLPAMYAAHNKRQLTIDAFLDNPTAPILIDLRGGSARDPSIPGSHRFYLPDVKARTEAFENRFAPQLTNRSLLLYCSKGHESTALLGQFSGNHPVQVLKGGMTAYLTAISRLLHEHPYEDPEHKSDTMVKILSALTDRSTPPATFQKIIHRLVQHTPNPEYARSRPSPGEALQKKLAAAAADILIFLIFSGDNCPLCTVLRQHLPWFAETYRRQVEVVVVDARKHAGLAEEYAIFSIPTVMVYRKGVRLQKQVGISTRAALKELLSAAQADSPP